MKNRITVLFFLICYCSHFVSAQSIEPSSLKYNGGKILYQKTDRRPYTGVIEGYVHCLNIPPVKDMLVQVKSILFNDDYYLYIDSISSTPYVKGYVVDGKAEWEWKVYQFKDSILLAEASFVKGELDGKVIIYDAFNILGKRCVIFYYKKRKFLFSESLK